MDKALERGRDDVGRRRRSNVEEVQRGSRIISGSRNISKTSLKFDPLTLDGLNPVGVDVGRLELDDGWEHLGIKDHLGTRNISKTLMLQPSQLAEPTKKGPQLGREVQLKDGEGAQRT